MKIAYLSKRTFLLCLVLFLLCACGAKPDASNTSATSAQQKTVHVGRGFQNALPKIPTLPAYRCGAWASNTTPGVYSVITIYARLSQDISGMRNIPAKALAHFSHGDVSLAQRPVSDTNGNVFFVLPLQGRQPSLQPTTVEVSFSVAGRSVSCSAFFTPL